MTDKDQNNSPEPNPADNEADLENLTSDEKAAFEKIMSQIGDPNDELGMDTKDPSPDREDPPVAVEKDGSVPTTATADDESLSDEQQAALDNIMADINGQDDTDPTEKNQPAAATNGDETLTEEQQAALDNIMADINGKDDDIPDPAQPDETPGEETLTDDQQAALDNIMAEINGKDEDDTPDPAQPDETPGEETLTDDQQAALDNIMAEIKGKDEDDTPDPAQPDETPGEETLTDDQQAALDNIMAEINGKDEDDTPDPAQPDETPGEETLTDDQQAALDNIMAEIKNKDDDTPDPAQPDQAPGGETTDSDQPTDVPADDETLTDDQQAALDKLMAEINGAKNSNPDSPAPSSDEATSASDQAMDDSPASTDAESPDPAEAEPKKSLKEELSLDEFNHELNNLLDISQKGASEKGDNTAPESESHASAADQGYAMLQEVAPGEQSSSVAQKRNKGAARISFTLSRSLVVKCALTIAILMVAAGAYWGYDRWFGKSMPEQQAISAQAPGLPAMIPSAATVEPLPPLGMASSPAYSPAASQQNPAAQKNLSPFAMLASDLSAARQRLQNKIDEINDLKAFYRKGVIEERQKIEARISTIPAPTYKQAIADSGIKLSLQAIQRRVTYIAKLDAPLKQLADLSEKLLYLERRNQLLEVLDKGLSGLPTAELKKDVAGAIAEQLERSQQLSIDQVKVPTPTIASIWEDLRKGEENTGGKKKRPVGQAPALDRKIMQEMCNGDYGRKYLLTSMSTESAKCLSKWQGKDLYLNNLTALTPGVAKVLAQWPGEWMSLNGITSISAESARHLSQWPGKRLSLNGLSSLSAQATAHLSKWHGEQLEMVGLKSIGRWENYGTRLFLSEKLKRRLKRP